MAKVQIATVERNKRGVFCLCGNVFTYENEDIIRERYFDGERNQFAYTVVCNNCGYRNEAEKR